MQRPGCIDEIWIFSREMDRSPLLLVEIKTWWKIDIPILNIFPPGKTNAKLHPQHLSFSPRSLCRIFGMHLHQESLELSRAIATRFVSTNLECLHGNLPLFQIYCAFVLKRVRREYQFPEENTNVSLSLSLVKLVRGSQGFQASLAIFNGYCNPVSLHRIRNKTEAFVKCIRTALCDHNSLHFPLERYYLRDVIPRGITPNWKGRFTPTLLSLLCSRRKSQSNPRHHFFREFTRAVTRNAFNPLSPFGRPRFKANTQIFTIVALLLGLKNLFPTKGEQSTTISRYK